MKAEPYAIARGLRGRAVVARADTHARAVAPARLPFRVRVALLIPAAGASRRYNPDLGVRRSKLDEDLGGRPVLQRAIEQFVKHPEIGPLLALVVVAGPHDPDAFAEFKTRHGDRLGLLGAALCRGGESHRHQTVLAALNHARTLPAWTAVTHVAVHDAARPCTPPELIERVFDAASKHPAVIPALDVTDTLKRVEERAVAAERDPVADILGLTGAGGRSTLRVVVNTVDRSGLVAAQTPQVFRKDLFEAAYAQADLTSSDDAQLVERLLARDAGRAGASGAVPDGSARADHTAPGVVVIPGDERNIKITRPADLRLARAILGVREPEQREVHKRF